MKRSHDTKDGANNYVTGALPRCSMVNSRPVYKQRFLAIHLLVYLALIIVKISEGPLYTSKNHFLGEALPSNILLCEMYMTNDSGTAGRCAFGQNLIHYQPQILG